MEGTGKGVRQRIQDSSQLKNRQIAVGIRKEINISASLLTECVFAYRRGVGDILGHNLHGISVSLKQTVSEAQQHKTGSLQLCVY